MVQNSPLSRRQVSYSLFGTIMGTLRHSPPGINFVPEGVISQTPTAATKVPSLWSRLISGVARLRGLPSLTPKPGVVNHEKTTTENLSNFLNVTFALINARNIPSAPGLISVVGSFMDYVITRSSTDPVGLIAEMKDAYSWYLDLIRGAPIISPMDKDFDFLNSPDYSRTMSALVPVLNFILKEYGNVVFSVKQKFTHQVIIAMLQSYRVISLAIEPNFGTVTGESTATYSEPELETEIKAAVSGFRWSPKMIQERLAYRTRNWSFYVSTKAGPNGPATESAVPDAKAIVADEDLWVSIFNLAHALKMNGIIGSLLAMADANHTSGAHLTIAKPIHSKLITIQEWGGKARVVAVLDIWTQTLLRPLHQAFGDILKTIPMDGVYNQDASSAKVKAWTSDETVKVFSYDLSAATDRLPLKVQKMALAEALGDQSLVNEWASVLTNRDYTTEGGQKVRYAVGQPMGAYSSFAVFDYTHHILIQVAAQRAGIGHDFQEYTIIGDDVTIADQDVANAYVKLMASLGVSINDTKSVVYTPSYLSAGEMAKRLYIAGSELSAIPVKLLAKLPRFGKLGPTVQNFLTSRGAIAPTSTLASFLAGILDRDSLVLLLKLNAAPSKVTGLSNPIPAIHPHLKIENWTSVITLSEEDIIDAYTYILITEQLKRVDALMRQTDLITDILQTSSRTDEGIIQTHAASLIEGMSPEARAKLFGALDRRHPVAQAAVTEGHRVGKVLAGLRSGTRSLTEVARLGLLDSLRNSVWTGIDETPESRDQITYSIFSSALVALDRILALPGLTPTGKPVPRSLEFTIPLLSLGRSYTVHWRLGKGVYVNMFRSKVSADQVENDRRLTLATESISMLRSHHPRKIPAPKPAV